jgi:hypothetical protein
LIPTLVVLASLNLVTTAAIAGVLAYSRRQKDRASDALLMAIERLSDETRKSKLEVVAPGPSLVGKTVVINTRKPDDQTIRGVVYGQYADRWTLRDASYVTGVGERPIENLAHVLRENIAFVQELGA